MYAKCSPDLNEIASQSLEMQVDMRVTASILIHGQSHNSALPKHSSTKIGLPFFRCGQDTHVFHSPLVNCRGKTSHPCPYPWSIGGSEGVQVV
jgi:hypothetical protein